MVTLRANVSSGGSSVLEGSLTFTDGGNAIANCATLSLDGNGNATCSAVFATEGVHSLVAAYLGTANFAPGNSNPFSQVVNNHTTNPSAGQYCNPGPIAILQSGSTGSPSGDPASPYPSTVYVSGLSGSLVTATVSINGITHSHISDVDMLLVSPAATTLALWSDVAAGAPVLNPPAANITLDDTAALFLPASGGSVSSGTFLPTAYNTSGDMFPAPAPSTFSYAAPFGSTTLFQAFNGINPNGTWQFFMVDQTSGSTGSIENGWCLNFITSTLPAPTVSVSSTANPAFTGASLTITATVQNGGIPVTQGTVTFLQGKTTLAGPLPLNASGQANFTIATLPEGANVIVANYNGSPGNFNTSSGSLTQQLDNQTTQQTSGNMTAYCNPNTGGLSISPNSSNAPAVPYPSHVFVTGFPAQPSHMSITLNGFSHNRPDDLESLLVGPTGNLIGSIDYFSRTGNMLPVSGVNLTFDDNAGGPVPSGNSIASGAYQPTSGNGKDVYPPPAPIPGTGSSYLYAAPAGSSTFGNVFGNLAPNGTWSFYFVQDTADGNAGSISGPICLNLYVAPDLTVAVTDNGPFMRSQPGTWTIAVQNAGAPNSTTASTVTVVDTLPSGYTLASATGAGWSCGSAANVVTCTSSAAVAGGGSFPALALNVSVPNSSPLKVVSGVTVSGGGESNLANDSATDTTTVQLGPSSLAIAGGSHQSTPAYTAFAAPLQAIVKNLHGTPIPGVVVNFIAQATTATGTFPGGVSSAGVLTDSNGLATSPVLTANGKAGTFVVNARVSGVSSAVQFSMTNTAPLPASIAVSGGSGQVVKIQTAFSKLLQAVVRDQGNKVVPGATVTFTAAASGPSGTFVSGATATVVTNANGVASAPAFESNLTAGSYAVNATVAGVSSPAVFTLTNKPGAAATAAANPSSGQSTAVLTAFATLQVLVQDAGFNPVPNVTVKFTAPTSGASGTFPGGVSSASVTTDSSGMATAPVFTANSKTGSYNVSAKVTGVAAAVMFSLTNTGVPASIAVFAGGGQSGAVLAAFPAALEAVVRDSGNHPLSGISVTFTAPASGPSGIFPSGLSASAVTNSAGLAIAPTFTANAVSGGPYVVTAQAAGVSTPASFSLTNLANGTVQIAINTSPAGLSFTVDGQPYSSPQTLTWVIGSTHTLATPTPQSATGTQFLWQSWSDSGVISHTVTAPATSTTYTATFQTQYLLTTGVNPPSSGSVGGGGYYNAGTQAIITATPNAGYLFGSFSGANSTPSQNPGTVTMNGPVTVTANLTALGVLTYHNDAARTGQNTLETQLNSGNVATATFGKLFTMPIDSWASAQPLYVPSVTIGGALHNVVYVATINNSVYAFDADNGTQLWQAQYGTPTSFTGLCTDNKYIYAPSGGAGIVGTPAIDPVAQAIYFVTKTGSGSNGNPYALYLHSVDIRTGADRPGSPVLIAPNVPGTTFLAQYHMARPAMLLSPAGDTVYVALGSTGCVGVGNAPAINNHGWVLSYTTSNLSPAGVFVTTPQTNNGGIWQGGGGIAQDSAGNLYVATADAVFDAANPPDEDYGDSILKLSSSTALLDYFTPYNAAGLNNLDQDLGSGAAVVIDNNQPGAAVPHLLVASGKVADIYVMSRDNLGQFCMNCSTTNTNIVQQIPKPASFGGCVFGTGASPNCRWGAPAYFNGGGPSNTATGYVYFPNNSAPLLSYPITNGVITTTPIQSAASYAATGSPSISANGTENAIVWVVSRGADTSNASNAGTLSALDAATLATLYTSDQAAGGRDTLGAIAHFITPTVVNGKVYVATQTQLAAYGLLP